MDCMIMPIQNKLEEWKKVTHSLDKDHARGIPFLVSRMIGPS